MLSFTKNRDQPQNRQVCLTTPNGECLVIQGRYKLALPASSKFDLTEPCKHWPEAVPPKPDRFMAYVNTPFMQ